MEKKFKSNAERQKAYRDRHRNATKPIARQIAAEKRDVTKDWRFEDPRYMFLGDFGYGPLFAYVLTKEDLARGCGPWPEGAAAVIGF